MTCSRGARNAVCSTARPSVALIFSPEHIALIHAGNSATWAKLSNNSTVLSVIRFFEKSKYKSHALHWYRSARPSSWNKSRRCIDCISSACSCRACHSAVWSILSIIKSVSFLNAVAENNVYTGCVKTKKHFICNVETRSQNDICEDNRITWKKISTALSCFYSSMRMLPQPRWVHQTYRWIASRVRWPTHCLLFT